MLVRSTILFILLSIQLLLAAPISYFPNTGLEPRGEHRPTLNDYPLHPYTKPDVNHYEHEVKVEPRQFLDLVKLGVEVGTNKNVQSAVKQGAQTIGSKIGGFFGGLFGHHK